MYRVVRLFGAVRVLHPTLDDDGVYTVTIDYRDQPVPPPVPPEEVIWQGTRMRDARRRKVVNPVHEVAGDDFEVRIIHLIEVKVGDDWIPRVQDSIDINPREARVDVVLASVTRWEPLAYEGWVDFIENIGGHVSYTILG